MSETVKMPALGESVTEGTVTRWLKNVGDQVAVDEPLLEVSTDKVDTEVTSPAAGVLEEILVPEDETVDVGADLCRIGDGSGGGDAAPAQEEAPAQQEAPQEQAPAQQEAPQEEAAAPQAAPQEQAAPQGGSGGGEPVKMPALGESVTEGTVTRWLKAEGDDVAVDEPLLEVSTDKVDTEVPSPVAGKLAKILVAEDETVEVGADLCLIGGSGDAAPAQEAPQQEAPKQETPTQQSAPEQAQQGQGDLGDEARMQQQAAQQSEQKAEQEAPKAEAQQEAPAQPTTPAQPAAPSSDEQQGDDTSAYVTPLVRKLAAEHGVDLASVKGTGIGGRIRKQDVLDAAKAGEQAAQAPAVQPAAAAAQAPAAAPAQQRPAGSPSAGKRGTTEKMSRLRQVIADRMVSSLQTAAQLTTVVEVDVTKVARLRTRVKDEFQAREGVKLTFLPFMAQAAVEALKQFPELNASVEGTEVTYHAVENLGIAVDTDRGLLVPVIKDAGDLNIAGLARKIADLADRTRSNKIGPDELGGATFTITNIGSAGAILDTPIINQPNVAILGTGAVVKRPVVVTDEDGQETIAVRSMCYLVLTYDHRLVDGANAARFLSAIKARLEEGSFEL